MKNSSVVQAIEPINFGKLCFVRKPMRIYWKMFLGFWEMFFKNIFHLEGVTIVIFIVSYYISRCFKVDFQLTSHPDLSTIRAFSKRFNEKSIKIANFALVHLANIRFILANIPMIKSYQHSNYKTWSHNYTLRSFA